MVAEDSAAAVSARWVPRPALAVAASYWLLGSLYIVASDYLAQHALGEGPGSLLVNAGKGLAFIAVTATLLFLVLERSFGRQRRALERLQGVLDAAEDAIVITDAAGRILSFNQGAERITGFTAQEAVGQHFRLLVPADNHADFDANMARLAASGRPAHQQRQEFTGQRKDGTPYPVSAAVTFRPYGTEALALHVFNDITSRREAQAWQQRQLRLQQRLVEVSTALLAAASDAAAYSIVCDFITAELGYPLAWVAEPYADDAEIYPLASSGPAARFVEKLSVRRDGSRLGGGPTGRALREHCVVVLNDLAQAPEYAPWLAQARAHGLAAKLSVPVMLEGAAAAVLSVYAGQPGAFTEEAAAPLQTMANLLAASVQRIRTAEREAREALQLAKRNAALEAQQELLQREFKERLLAEEDLLHQEQNSRRILEGLGIPIAVAQDGRIKFVNQAFADAVQYERAELVGQLIDIVLPPEIREAVRARQLARQAGQPEPTLYESMLLRRDGRRIHVARNIVRIEFNGHPAGLVVDIDLTDLHASRSQLELALEATGATAWEWDVASGRLTDVGGLYPALGYDPQAEPLTASRWFALMAPADLARVQELLAGPLAHGTDRVEVAYRLRAADGAYRGVLSRAQVVERDAAGQPLRLVGTTLLDAEPPGASPDAG
jgi:PAS domain S-box-containing protein